MAEGNHLRGIKMEIIIGLSVVLGLVALAVTVVIIAEILMDWKIDNDMTKRKCMRYGRANYKQFLSEFNKRHWKIGTLRSIECIDDEKSEDVYPASFIFPAGGIIRFNNIGMLMKNPVSHIKMIRFVKNYTKSNINNKFNWPKE